MKNKIKLIIGILFLLEFLTSCNNHDIIPIANVDFNLEFEESVVFMQHGAKSTYNKQNKKNEYVLLVEIKDFSNKKLLCDFYIIDGIKYSDNGELNDINSNDGIYTSIEKFSYEVSKKSDTFDGIIINKSDKFKYDQLYFLIYSNPKLYAKKVKIKLGCKLRTVTCPETDIWTTCWPFSSPCTCVEYYDCEFEIEVEL